MNSPYRVWYTPRPANKFAGYTGAKSTYVDWLLHRYGLVRAGGLCLDVAREFIRWALCVREVTKLVAGGHYLLGAF